MNGQFGIAWKEAVKAYLEALSGILLKILITEISHSR
jgi:hypothetical protein